MSRTYEVACRSFLGDCRNLDIWLLFMVYTSLSRILTATIEGGQYSLPVILYGQGMALTLRIET